MGFGPLGGQLGRLKLQEVIRVVRDKRGSNVAVGGEYEDFEEHAEVRNHGAHPCVTSVGEWL